MFYTVLYGFVFCYLELPLTLEITRFWTIYHCKFPQTLDMTDGTDFAEMLEKR